MQPWEQQLVSGTCRCYGMAGGGAGPGWGPAECRVRVEGLSLPWGSPCSASRGA